MGVRGGEILVEGLEETPPATVRAEREEEGRLTREGEKAESAWDRGREKHCQIL